MPAPKLSVGDVGDDVAQLHQKLGRSGLNVSPEEIKRKFFGPSTRAAVADLQRATNVEVTGHVDDATHALLTDSPSPPLTATSRTVPDVVSRVPTGRIPPGAVPAPPPNGGGSAAQPSGPERDVAGQI